MLENSYPLSDNVSGNIHFTIKNEEMAVIAIEDQFPKFKAL